jgi:hypothetical protein
LNEELSLDNQYGGIIGNYYRRSEQVLIKKEYVVKPELVITCRNAVPTSLLITELTGIVKNCKIK